MGRVLAIGDIHGCAGALEALLDAVRPGPDDTVVTLGDYVDRGRRSRQVLERLIALGGQTRLVPILGNHDQMMVDARSGDPAKQWWLEHEEWGGPTLASYGPGAGLDEVPEAHWAFLRGCAPWFETTSHLFVHAGLAPDLPLDLQDGYTLRWEPFRDPRPHASGKTLVCGHTAQKSGRPRDVGHAVCIDTWPYGRGGWLTCLDVPTRRYWQATEGGEVREDRLS